HTLAARALRLPDSSRRGLAAERLAVCFRFFSLFPFPFSLSYCFPICTVFIWESNMADVWQGTWALLVLKTLDTLGSMHGYALARRIEQTSGGHLSVNY